MSHSTIAAYDPSVGDYADTSPFEWGGKLERKKKRPALAGLRFL
jgi:hypothetical protein